MTYRYDGIGKDGKYKRGIITADSEVDALAKIRERDDVLLITNLNKQSNNKVVSNILITKDKSAEKIKNLFTRTKVEKTEKISIGDRLKNMITNSSSVEKIKKAGEKIPTPTIFSKKSMKEHNETYEELINIFNSESFREMREERKALHGVTELNETKRVIGVGDPKEGKSIDWELLRNRREMVEKNSNKHRNEKIKVKKKDILLFTKRLQIMLASGMTLVNTLRVLASGDQKRGLSTLINKLIESLQSGNTFSESLSLFPKQFDYLYVSLVSIGESSGTIHEILLDIIDAKEQEDKISKKLNTAMVYPALMGIVLIAILLLGSIFFIPAFEEMFTEQDMALPAITTITFGVAAVMPYIIAGIFAFIAIFILLKKKIPALDNVFTRTRDKLLLTIPVIKSVKTLSYMHSFSFTVSLMLKNGIRLKDALEMAKETISNVHIKEQIANVSLMMTEGLTMSEALEVQPHFDEIITNVALTGEESGQMSFSLEQIANYYKSELEKAIETAMEFIEPISIVLIALIVLPVILAVYLPVLDISSGATLDI